jgi:hypothetical protein
MIEFRPVFPNERRDLPPEIARIAIFEIPLAFDVRDDREASDKTVGGCEGSSCTIPTREAEPNG